MNKKRKKNKNDLIFYCLLMLIPAIQFCIFYIGVNTKSVLMAFQTIDIQSGTVEWTLSNIKNAFKLMTTSPEMLSLMSVSVRSYLILLGIGTPLGLLFSYYIYKKLPFSSTFRVLLFLPSIISAIILAVVFQFFFERAIPAFAFELFGIQIKGLMENEQTRYMTIMFYNILIGFGTSVLMYANAMSGISQEMVEAAQLDGATKFQEFWHITLPSIYPTLTTFLFTGVAGIFTNQIHLFSFYGAGAPEEVRTYGYYFYTMVKSAQSEAEYPLLAAMGLLMTLVAVPLTFLVKWALEKFGPSEN